MKSAKFKKSRQLHHRSNHRDIGRRHRIIRTVHEHASHPDAQGALDVVRQTVSNHNDSLAFTPASVNAAVKMLGCGFM